MPRFQVDGKGTLALPTALVHVPGRIVEHPQHGHQACGWHEIERERESSGPLECPFVPRMYEPVARMLDTEMPMPPALLDSRALRLSVS